MNELIYKFYDNGDLIAAFKDEEDLERFKIEYNMHVAEPDCLDGFRRNE